MNTIFLYALVCTALWYLGAAAGITYSLRARLPYSVATFLACPACAGTWYGLGCGLYGVFRGWSFLDLGSVESVLAAGAFGLVVTPLLTTLHSYCLIRGYALLNEATTQGSSTEL